VADATTPLGVPVKRHGWRRFLMTVVGRAYPRVIGSLRERSWVFFEVALPLLAIAAYGLVYRTLNAPPEYLGFVVIGGAMVAFWANVTWGMASQLYWEKETGNLGLYIVAPTSLMAILVGMATGGLIGTSVRAVAILVTGSLLFHIPWDFSQLPLLTLVFALTMAALYGLGMMLASVFLLLNREAWQLAEAVQEPVTLLAGFYFPVASLPFGLAAGSSIIPMTLGLDAMRQLLFPHAPHFGFLPVRVEMLALVGLGVVYCAAAWLLLGAMERLAAREGRLTESRS
jgi:ABC-2 type transport system permease protein